MDIPGLKKEAIRILKANDRGGYTVPSARLYPHQWAWDSAFSALGWMSIDPDRAVRELELLMHGQWSDGRVPHIHFHDLSGHYFPGPEFWGTRDSSTISQPPVWATVARRMYERGADKQRIRALLRPFRRSHSWWHEQRDPLEWSLVGVTHPWESGMDNSPVWDSALAAVDPSKAPPFKRVDKEIVGDASQRPTDDQYRRYAALVQEIRDNHFGPSSFLVYDPFMTAVLARAEEDLGWLLRQCGLDDVRSEWGRRYRQGLVDHLWSEERQRFLFYDVSAGRAIDEEVLAAYLPLMLDLPGPIAEACRGALLERYQSAWILPTVPPGAPHFEAVRYWRGPVWVNTNWLLCGKLPELARRTLELVERGGFREYFNPLTGEGLGAQDFGWTASLTLDLLAQLDSQYPR